MARTKGPRTGTNDCAIEREFEVQESKNCYLANAVGERCRERGKTSRGGRQGRDPRRPRWSILSTAPSKLLNPLWGSNHNGLEDSASRAWSRDRQTSSFFAPIKVRSRSASKLASNGFLKVSLMLDRSKLIGLPSSGSRAIRMVSEKSAFLRRF